MPELAPQPDPRRSDAEGGRAQDRGVCWFTIRRIPFLVLLRHEVSMLRQRSFAFALAAAATVALGSCSDDATLPSAPSAPSTAPDLTLTGAQQDLADDPVALARAVPGFGGFFVDGQG